MFDKQYEEPWQDIEIAADDSFEANLTTPEEIAEFLAWSAKLADIHPS